MLATQRREAPPLAQMSEYGRQTCLFVGPSHLGPGFEKAEYRQVVREGWTLPGRSNLLENGKWNGIFQTGSPVSMLLSLSCPCCYSWALSKVWFKYSSINSALLESIFRLGVHTGATTTQWDHGNRKEMLVLVEILLLLLTFEIRVELWSFFQLSLIWLRNTRSLSIA